MICIIFYVSKVLFWFHFELGFKTMRRWPWTNTLKFKQSSIKLRPRLDKPPIHDLNWNQTPEWYRRKLRYTLFFILLKISNKPCKLSKKTAYKGKGIADFLSTASGGGNGPPPFPGSFNFHSRYHMSSGNFEGFL